MKLIIITFLLFSSFLIVPFAIKEPVKTKKTLPRKQATQFRQSLSLSTNPEEIFSSSSTSSLSSEYQHKISDNGLYHPPTPLSSELLSSFYSSTIRATIKNSYLLQKKKYATYFKRITLGLAVSLTTKIIFSLIPNPPCIYIRIVFFTIANGYCCFGKTKADAIVHLIKQIIKFFGYAYISLIIAKRVNKKRILFKASIYAIITIIFDYYMDFIIKTLKLD